jgi:hypothetical protein
MLSKKWKIGKRRLNFNIPDVRPDQLHQLIHALSIAPGRVAIHTWCEW